MGIKIDRTGDKRGKRFCPLMKEWCVKGWTPSMGKTAEDFPIEGACAAWEPMDILIESEGRTVRVFDCTEFRWKQDVAEEISKETFQAGASTDKVANEVAKFHATSIACMPDEARIELMASNPRLMPKLQDTNLSQKRLPDAEEVKQVEQKNGTSSGV